MATIETAPRSQDKLSRLKPFAWVKRLASRRGSSSDRLRTQSKRGLNLASSRSKKSPSKSPEKGQGVNLSVTEDPPNTEYQNGSYSSLPPNADGNHATAVGNQSMAPTFGTNPGTVHSEADHHSKAGTSNTIGGAMSSASGGANSIFSSSNHSSHSLTTTLTTIQSAQSYNALHQQPLHGAPHGSFHHAQHSQSSASTQFPTTPASAVPAHLNPHHHLPATYRSATANNLLSDNASVITLASSSNRRHRRNSLDTNASIRAIAPSSVYGGSRESLPLSVLSQTANESTTGASTGAGAGTAHTPPSTSGTQVASSSSQQRGAERTSVVSAGGVGAPVLSSERNSIYTGKKADGDGGSVKSGSLGHGRNESITGSIGGYTSPLASPRAPSAEDERSSLAAEQSLSRAETGDDEAEKIG